MIPKAPSLHQLKNLKKQTHKIETKLSDNGIMDVKDTAAVYEDKDEGANVTVSEVGTNNSAACPALVRGVKIYLEKTIPGIGPKNADMICLHFDTDVFEVLLSADRLVEVNGINEKVAESIARITKTDYNRDDFRDLLLFLGKHQTHIGPILVKHILSKYKNGDNILEEIKKDPYHLLETKGLTFDGIDELASALGFPHNSPERFNACIDHLLTREKNTAWSRQQFTTLMLSKPYLYTDCSQLMERTKRILHLESDGKLFIQHCEQYQNEDNITNDIHRINEGNSSLSDLDADVNHEIESTWENLRFKHFTRSQQLAVDNALEHKVSVLTGGPGTGKTLVMGALVHTLLNMNAKIMLLAPTGAAARKLSESTKQEARTIHSVTHTVKKFNDFVADFVIIDEASMLDTSTAKELLDIIPDSSHVLFVGDHDQLPPIGPGRVLEDLIESKVVHITELTERFRQSEGSDIVTHAQAINSGNIKASLPDTLLSSVDDLSVEEGLQFVKCSNENLHAVLKKTCSFVTRELGFDGLTELQIISPQRIGDKGVNAMNKTFQELNQEPTLHKAFIFKRNDRVMQTKNDRSKGVVNGDIGVVKSVQNGYTGKPFLIVNFDRRHVEYFATEADVLDLAYATTVHKSQGAEYQAIVIVLPEFVPHMLLSRRLLYTAVTRGKKHVIIIGSDESYRRAISNNSSRCTLLSGSLKGEVKVQPQSKLLQAVYKSEEGKSIPNYTRTRRVSFL